MALAVQSRRFNSGKKGVAKAVRRYLLRSHPENYTKLKIKLPARWPEKRRVVDTLKRNFSRLKNSIPKILVSKVKTREVDS